MSDFNLKGVMEEYRRMAENRNWDVKQKDREQYVYTDEMKHFDTHAPCSVQRAGLVGTRPINETTLKQGSSRSSSGQVRVTINHDGGQYSLSAAYRFRPSPNKTETKSIYDNATTGADGLRDFLTAIVMMGNLKEAWESNFGDFEN